ncbi:MAG: hypothetical protein B7Z08_02905 [Sphingomonadales bacterium 32-68-7]|nr:MAG: hypothetical protein B7Z33_13070 [Sphingomonadales bacterium 12-68-11]OYX09997.1 MAG: hypothetical protein B7Z08_02905 [Sphingomonadales bacterium 32-68-7]
MTQFDTAFVNVAERLAAIRDGDLVFSTDRDNLNGLLKIMTDAAALPETKAALSRYKASNRVRVVKQVRRTRNERYCYYYGAYIDECLLWDTRRVPYTANQVTYELPKGVVSHRDLFERYQTNYLGTMSERADGNLSEAALARDEILEANIRGGEQLRSALFAAGSFLAVMFFFLIIAIERHQRKIARHLDSTWPSDLSG